jgi:hypothetical protein
VICDFVNNSNAMEGSERREVLRNGERLQHRNVPRMCVSPSALPQMRALRTVGSARFGHSTGSLTQPKVQGASWDGPQTISLSASLLCDVVQNIEMSRSMIKGLEVDIALIALALIARPLCAEDAALAEKVRDVSPDQKFALRISYDPKEDERIAAQNDPGEHRLPDGMFSRAVTEIDLVSLPAKEKVVDLFKPDLGTNFGDITLLWSADSRWFAYYDTQLGVGDTDVYTERDGKFVKVNSSSKDLSAKVKGDFRNEWIRPIKWLKPGVLMLEDEAIGNSGHVKFELTAKINTDGSVQVLSKKKLKVKAEKE